jgi:hypothetical protein
MKCPHCHKRINIGALLASKRSKASQAASKANGAKGGRPRKITMNMRPGTVPVFKEIA